MLESIPYSVVVIAAVALSALCVLAALLHRFGRIVPEANWPLLGNSATNSLFWHAATSDSLSLTWLNALLNRDTNFPVSFQASLDRSGDFTFRYDPNASALSSNASIAAFIDGFGESNTNGPATTLRRASLAGLANDADFDGDGLSDADEVLLHFTNPRLADSDLDGLSDWREEQTGTDPFDPDEGSDGVPDGVVPADWYGNALWATNATSGVIVTVTLNHAIPAGARAAFLLDDLSIPLHAPASWSFAFDPGVSHDYRLFVSDGATVDLSITAADPGQAQGLLRGAETTPLWAEGDGGVFVGPSGAGGHNSQTHHIPSIVYDYVESPDLAGRIPMGHPQKCAGATLSDGGLPQED